MRLWSLHPRYLDSKGLVALWREGLLAQKVLQGKTSGYKNHPQLIRFKQTSDPLGAMARYLRSIVNEANKRGYSFDENKIAHLDFREKIPVTKGQIEYEVQHLLNKLKKRDVKLYDQLKKDQKIELHSIFRQIEGSVESWEVRH